MTEPLARKAGAFSETTIDDETVVMSLASGEFFSLTGTAAAIWARLDGTRTREALIAELSAEHDASREAIAGDVDAFLGQLRGAGLIDGG